MNPTPSAVGANATLLGAQSTIQAGNQCFMPTDGRGYGYWASCDRGTYTFVDHSSDGGGGDGR
jgi:hypothetical protein